MDIILALMVMLVSTCIYFVLFGSKECFECGVQLSDLDMPIYSDEHKGKRLCRECKLSELHED